MPEVKAEHTPRSTGLRTPMKERKPTKRPEKLQVPDDSTVKDRSFKKSKDSINLACDGSVSDHVVVFHVSYASEEAREKTVKDAREKSLEDNSEEGRESETSVSFLIAFVLF